MNANGIRLGNWIYDLDRDRNVQVAGIPVSQNGIYVDWKNGAGQYTTTFNNIKPIPITEEILLKAGGKAPTESFDYYGGFLFHVFKDYKIRIRFINDRWIWDNVGFTVEIKYLHQLQNLYWCLCGKELTITL